MIQRYRPAEFVRGSACVKQKSKKPVGTDLPSRPPCRNNHVYGCRATTSDRIDRASLPCAARAASKSCDPDCAVRRKSLSGQQKPDVVARADSNRRGCMAANETAGPGVRLV